MLLDVKPILTPRERPFRSSLRWIFPMWTLAARTRCPSLCCGGPGAQYRRGAWSAADGPDRPGQPCATAAASPFTRQGGPISLHAGRRAPERGKRRDRAAGGWEGGCGRSGPHRVYPRDGQQNTVFRRLQGTVPRCGADLNLGPCSCKKEVDPRLAVLAKLLEKENE